jgi:hypothetical protein
MSLTGDTARSTDECSTVQHSTALRSTAQHRSAIICTWDTSSGTSSEGFGIDPTYPHREVTCDDRYDMHERRILNIVRHCAVQ